MRPPHSSEAVQIPSGGGDRTTVAFKRVGPALALLGSATSSPYFIAPVSRLSPPLLLHHLPIASSSHPQGREAARPSGERSCSSSRLPSPERRRARSVRRLLFLFRPWERLVLGRVRCSTGWVLGLTSERGFESNRFLLLFWVGFGFLGCGSLGSPVRCSNSGRRLAQSDYIQTRRGS